MGGHFWRQPLFLPVPAGRTDRASSSWGRKQLLLSRTSKTNWESGACTAVKGTAHGRVSPGCIKDVALEKKTCGTGQWLGALVRKEQSLSERRELHQNPSETLWSYSNTLFNTPKTQFTLIISQHHYSTDKMCNMKRKICWNQLILLVLLCPNACVSRLDWRVNKCNLAQNFEDSRLTHSSWNI